MEMKSAIDCWIEAEAQRREINTSRICTFGIKPLDDAFVGILPNDLIVIGADSGVGKSEIAIDIATHNAYMQRKVGLYFIEGGATEAINRIRWKIIKQKYYDSRMRGLDMEYRNWRMNLLPPSIIEPLDFNAMKEFDAKIKDNLQIYSFEDGFTIDMLTNSLGWFAKEKPGKFLMETHYDIDLLVIDHLQYFTLDNPKNEFSEMSQILMKVKQITNFYNIPVILISHLRKRDKERGLPSQEDFYGTSNIAKIASQAVTIASYYQGDQIIENKYPTFFRFVKSRTGIRPNIAALCSFDAHKGKYDDAYEIYKLIADSPEGKPLEPYKYPSWARKEIK